MKPGDCFLMKGDAQEKSMTLYRIDNFSGEKLYAYALYVSEDTIQGMDFPFRYDNHIPSDAIILPKDTYRKVKEQMKTFVREAHRYIRENIIIDNATIELGKHYYDARTSIDIVKKIEGGRVYYETFRIEHENISPCWKGDANVDGLADDWYPIPEYVYKEILVRYKRFYEELREYLSSF